ncbi:hypothetical protein PFLUV_G00039780 [Perca fluviatilis]|uniref:MyoD family inhibitor domain-containing protein n=1 Tax=Perca fluviatilis TaxID=8168 RepID=A0A6A5EPL5_PERFL|nr:uncharacterized protein si:dkey-245f22.3 [Perca fluviatilis]XP_039653891.1 uncharacterized protein si:dkey-245f22.3 [Perca fluviatilis]KAF1391231.1 hypothetical protein PFLUV_G00039780 [Perca fluviatilis]
MDVKLDSTDMNEKMGDGSEGKSKFHDSLTIASKLPIIPDNSIAGPTGSLTEVTSFSEQISTEDTELSSTVNVFPKVIEINLPDNLKGGVTRAVSICGPCSVEQEQPKPLCALLPSSMEACTVYEVSQSITSISRSQESLKITTVRTEPDGDDLCAAILLACLFCHPLDCLLAMMRGCNECVWSLCSSLCGCELRTLQPLLDITHHCDLCGCLGVRCFLCDCPACDICLQATECLDLALEFSQMLYH